MIFSKSFKLVIINLSISNMSLFAIDVIPEGTLITKFPTISKNPTVRMYFNKDKPPVINLTPSRPTVVQFPEEINNCVSAYKLIAFDYSDKLGGKQTSDSGSSSEWFSSVTFSVNPDAIKNISAENLLKMPETGVVCKVRVSSPDSNSASYTLQTIGIKIVDPNDTYFIVYLLKANSNSVDNLLTENELNQLPYIDVTKIQKDHIKNGRSNSFISKNNEVEKPKIKTKFNENSGGDNQKKILRKN